MLWRCTVCYGGVLCASALYWVVNCVLRRCTVCYGRLLCGRAVYCMLDR